MIQGSVFQQAEHLRQSRLLIRCADEINTAPTRRNKNFISQLLSKTRCVKIISPIPPEANSSGWILPCSRKYEGIRLALARNTDMPIKVLSVVSSRRKLKPTSGKTATKSGNTKQCTAQTHEAAAPNVSNRRPILFFIFNNGPCN